MSELNFTFEQFDVNDQEDIHMRWTKWLTRFNRYLTHTKTAEDVDKINALFLFGGYDLEQIQIEKLPNETVYATITKMLNEHFNPTTGQFLNRYNFHYVAQRESESFDEFVARVKLAAKSCNFTSGKILS